MCKPHIHRQHHANSSLFFPEEIQTRGYDHHSNPCTLGGWPGVLNIWESAARFLPKSPTCVDWEAEEHAGAPGGIGRFWSGGTLGKHMGKRG